MTSNWWFYQGHFEKPAWMTTIMLVILVKQYETSHNLPFLGKSGDVYCIFLGMAITICSTTRCRKRQAASGTGRTDLLRPGAREALRCRPSNRWRSGAGTLGTPNLPGYHVDIMGIYYIYTWGYS